MKKVFGLAVVFVLLCASVALSSDLDITAEALREVLDNAMQQSLKNSDGDPMKIGELVSQKTPDGQPGYCINADDFVKIFGALSESNSNVKSIVIDGKWDDTIGAEKLSDAMLMHGFSSGFLMTIFAENEEENMKIMDFFRSTVMEIQTKSDVKDEMEFKYISIKIELSKKGNNISNRITILPL